MISQGFVESIKKSYKDNSGIDISDEEARDGAERLVSFFNLLIKVDQRNKAKE